MNHCIYTRKAHVGIKNSRVGGKGGDQLVFIQFYFLDYNITESNCFYILFKKLFAAHLRKEQSKDL